jgi:ribosome biogenesis protein Nip4
MSSEKGSIKFESINTEELKKILSKIEKDFDCKFSSKFYDNHIFFKYVFNNFIKIYYINKNEFITNLLKYLINKNINFYSIGICIITIKNNKIIPLLGFGEVMIEYCRQKIKLPYGLIYKFTYGKSIRVKERIKNGYYIILSKNNEFIGYAKVVKEHVIIPIKDIGWYLRRGG